MGASYQNTEMRALKIWRLVSSAPRNDGMRTLYPPWHRGGLSQTIREPRCAEFP